MFSFLKPEIAGVARVARPSTALGAKYNEGSTAIYQGLSQILNGKPAKSVLPGIASKLEALLKQEAPANYRGEDGVCHPPPSLAHDLRLDSHAAVHRPLRRRSDPAGS